MPFLDDACTAVKRWLSLLGITDRVKVEIGQIDPSTNAVTYINADYLEALIVFNDPAICGHYDLEEVAAHEVFHIPMADFKTQAGTPQRSAEERAVERFSRAFVALWRGTAPASRVSLAPTLRAIIASSPRARQRIAARKRVSMPEELMTLLMSAGEAAGREDVPEDVKELLRKLAAAAVTGEAPPAGEPGDAPPEAEAEPKPEDEPPAPAARAGLSAKARKALDAADAAAEQAEALARKRVSLETTATRTALFDSAPDVFGGGKAKRREIYASAPIDEIERYIKSQREESPRANPDDHRARAGNDPHREPPTGGSKTTLKKNDGGLVVRGGGN
jgi:hypothetical protein